MNEIIFSKGRIFELVHIPQTDGRIFEVARRAPGVRVIVADTRKRELLLTKEHRWELDAWDYRLPGGKVFDTLAEFDKHRKSGKDLAKVAQLKAQQEAAEEAGIDVTSLAFFKKSSLGATVEWDLYVFEATKWHTSKNGQNPKEDERRGIEVRMFPYAEVERMILAGAMQEERVALIILQWLKKQG